MMDALALQLASDAAVCEHGPWMIPCAQPRPSGAERGTVFVVGVGGSTLRLTRVCVRAAADPAPTAASDIMSTEIPDAARRGDLFAWCAEQLAPHLAAHCPAQHQGAEAAVEAAAEAQAGTEPRTEPQEGPPLLALSWSFPLVGGCIQTMGKTFSERFVGCDVLAEFNRRLPPRFQIRSVTHDGLSSLVAGTHAAQRCTMALTLGTGVNIAVAARDVLVNTEISMLGRRDTTPSIVLATEPWDVAGAAAAFQPFETQVGGLWLGPMASRALGEPLTTLDLWAVLQAPDDRRYAAVDAIVRRAAALVAASLFGLAMAFTAPGAPGAPPQQVAYTGGVVFEPAFRARLEAELAALAAKFGFALQLLPQRQGSEVGAAIAALAAQK